MRTHACGQLRSSDTGVDVALCGWVAHRRDHGGVTFIDLRDREGVVQLVFHPDDAPQAHEAAQSLGAEDVVRVTGAVRARPAGMVNPALDTGEVEVAASTLELLSESDTPPFPIEDRTEANEMLRLKYRYLDLRRPEMSSRLRLRHEVDRITREFLADRGFVEIETPILTRSTPEGARDFLVPSRMSKGTFYALPQSPQQLKQMLMVAGQDRYFQIVRCFRDEDLRADRQFEFTQLDVEMSFITEEDVIGLMEPLMARLLSELRGVELKTPFPRMTYADMMRRYGSDKPDLRYGMELADLDDVFAGTSFNAFASVVPSGGRIQAIVAPGGAQLSRKELDDLVTQTKGRGAAGLVWMVVEEIGVRSPVHKHLSAEEIAGVLEATAASPGDLVLIVADRPDRVAVALDGLRRTLAVRLDLIPENTWAFCWMVEPPLFEWSDEEGKWVSVHHLFTAPAGDDLDPVTARARGYDLILNGYELGGGSIRIHRRELQRKVFEILGLSDQQIQEKFGHMLEAFRFGAPPHGGVALGWDRLVMLLAGQDAITEVIAFPKTQSGSDPLTGAPAPVSEDQLRDLGLRLVERPKKES
ncbi:MAG: aspartate--tRNA ligase [Actinomycetota bacterium]